VRPESTGERDEAYLRDIMPRYSDMAPYYDEMLAGFERWNPDFDINIGNLPHCILPAWGLRIHHGGQETVTKSSNGAGLEDEMNKYEWQSSLRTHLPGCAACIFRSRCTGIFRGYLELHGGDEFRPVSREALAGLDPQRRNFVVLVEPLLAALRAALAAGDLPAAWRFRQEVTEDRRRSVEMSFVHDGGQGVSLRFVRPGDGRAPVIRSDAYDVDAEADLAAPVEALAGLLEWAREHLAGAPEAAAPALAADAVERALRGAVLRRGRQRVGSLTERLHSRFAVPGWRLEPLRWPSESSGELVVRGPGDARVDALFSLGVRGNRSQVGVEFRPADPGESDGARAIIDALVALLRGAHPAAADAARQSVVQ
jgi:hypothetical protein